MFQGDRKVESFFALLFVLYKKQEKDRLAVRNIWPYLDKESAYAIYTTLTKKEKKTVDAFMTENNMTFSSF